MADDFVTQFTKPLLLSLSSDHGPATGDISSALSDLSRKHVLHELLSSLDKTHISLNDVRRVVAQLQEYTASAVESVDQEEEILKNAIVSKVVIALYADALNTYLLQAIEVEAEAQWWADVERSKVNVAWYLLQTLPIRLVNLVKTIIQTVRQHNLPVTLSTFRPSSLRCILDSASTSSLRPGALLMSLFPQPLSLTSSASILPASAKSTSKLSLKTIWANIFLPLALTKQECQYNRVELENIRDEKARVLGELALLRGEWAASVEIEYSNFLQSLIQTVSPSSLKILPTTKSDTIPLIQFLSTTLSSLSATHTSSLKHHHLIRPSRIALLWPKLVILPPLTLYTLKFCYSHQTTFFEVVRDAKETVASFIQGWLVEPLREILRTVKAGGAEGEQGVLVRKEGVLADLESLERMTLSLAADVLRYTPQQLDVLSEQVKSGDLTPVMRIYEEEIRHPLKSAFTGSLVRGVLVQVQKAKVDIDQALTGIDRLLKSQELTFAFVGVAPALAIVYLVLGVLGKGLWNEAGRARIRYGGPTRRGEVWSNMRRIERLLIAQPSTPKSRHGLSTNPDRVQEQEQLPALSTGLILLSITRLRAYARQCLPTSSSSSTWSTHTYPSVGGMRSAFLEDVTDLEDPGLGRHAKMKVVERMWRCWSDVLGWRDRNP